MMRPNTRVLGGTMRTRTATATVVLLLTLAGCTSEGPEPAQTVTATATVSPPLDKAQVTQACMDAVAEIAKQSEGEVPSEPTPAPCTPLSDSEYLDAYMDGIMQSNRDALEELQRELDAASKSATAN